MKTFRDNAGRTWTISINVTAIKRVRGFLGGFDLLKLIDDKFEGLGKLLGDPVQLVDVLYVLCKEEADRLNVSDEEFGRSMAGDAIEAATNAFLAEYVDFFPDPRVRAGITKVLEKSKEAARAVSDHAMNMIEDIPVELMTRDAIAQINAAARKLRGSSGNGPVLSESTPEHSHSES